MSELEAERRGRDRALNEIASGQSEPGSPLSGEWAGESITELLGDLVAGYVEVGVSESDATEWVCDDFERGYFDEWDKVTA